MKKCSLCGKEEYLKNVRVCSECGGPLIVVSDSGGGFCNQCGNALGANARFCENCGARQDRDEIQKKHKKKAGGNIAVTVTLTILLVVALVICAVFGTAQYLSLKQVRLADGNEVVGNTSVEKQNEPIDNEQSETSTQNTEVAENSALNNENGDISTELQQEEKTVHMPQEPPQEPEITVSRYELEEAVDCYVQSYVSAMNTGDSTYMLPYVIPGCSLYNTQKDFIKNGYYEEYIDSYIIGDVELEDRNTCVVSVYEIYNVEKPGTSLARTEQTAKYRMKRDSDGYWKMYSFVGSVKIHK